MPIVGFNVIEEITKQPVDCASAGVGESVVDAQSSSVTGVEKEKVEALVNLIKTESAQELCSIKSRKQDTLLPKGQSVIVSCHAAIGPVGKVLVLFELDPDSSYPSDLEIPETQLTVTSASTCRVNIRVDNPSKHDVVLKVLGCLQQVKSSVDTEELSEEQKTIVKKMLEEEAESFSQTDYDVGRSEELHWIHDSETLKQVKLKMFLFQSWTMELKNHALH